MVFENFFFPKSVRKFWVSLKSGNNHGYRTQRAMWIYDNSLFLIMRNVNRETLQRKWKKHISYWIASPPSPSPENRAVYEIMWKNVAESGKPQMRVWRMRIACWVPKAINTHSEYVILIAVPVQQRLHERASMLRYTYIACLVRSSFPSSSESSKWLLILWFTHRNHVSTSNLPHTRLAHDVVKKPVNNISWMLSLILC